MPNIDGGHYWLTALIPINTKPQRDHDLLWTQPINLVRRALAFMPTAQQSPASIEMSCNTGYVSPFSHNDRNHFVRFAVINTLAYNGRQPMDSVVQIATKVDMNQAQPVDLLRSEYLLFAAEFDAPSGDELELEIYLDTLWATISPIQLNDLFSRCVGWEGVQSSADFCRWIRRCQVTTSLPFNDYWITPPPFPRLQVQSLAAAGAVAMLLRGVDKLANTQWPQAPGSDLPSILKALYLQRKFIDFAIDVQGLSPDELYARFAEFADLHQPAAAAPTQPPGVVNAADLAKVAPDLQRPYSNAAPTESAV